MADLYFNSISVTSGQRKGDNEIYAMEPPLNNLPSARNQILTASLASQRLRLLLRNK